MKREDVIAQAAIGLLPVAYNRTGLRDVAIGEAVGIATDLADALGVKDAAPARKTAAKKPAKARARPRSTKLTAKK